MKILHYFLGFPPYRSGGLTKYVVDLMQAQVEDGHEVLGLWPGQMKIKNKKISIKSRKAYKSVINYEIINPLPVPLDEGIIATDINQFMDSCNGAIYVDFLEKINPDVIHVHTLMGIHKEFFRAAKKLGIYIVYTTHDYFGLCPKVTFFSYGRLCEDDYDCRKCVQCNASALSIKKIMILQSGIYRLVKDSFPMKMFRKIHRSNFFGDGHLPEMIVKNDDIIAQRYKLLRRYYQDIFEMMDIIHFNSSVAENVYRKYINIRKSKCFSITHKEIKDNRANNINVIGDKIRFVMLAPAKPFKGFGELRNVLDEIWDLGKQDFELILFSPVQNPAPYMRVYEKGYEYKDLPEIFKHTDILIAYSSWYETFGFTVLEALSYGVPVLVSERVGAKDIIGNGGIIIEASNKKALKNAILELDRDKIKSLREEIILNCRIKTWKQFMKENYLLYFERGE